MAFNYAKEKLKFDAEWKQKASWYRKVGMSESDIDEMYRFDLMQFNRDRAYESRRRPLETAYGSCCVQISEANNERHRWINEINDPQLAEQFHALTDQELDLLTLIAIEGKTHKEAAEILSCSRQCITKQLARIRKIFKAK